MEKKKVVITGITGFAGSHLAEYLVTQPHYEVIGTYNSESSLRHIASIKDKVQVEQINMTDAQQVADFIARVKPDLIFHLAALAAASKSFENPAMTINANITMQVNLFEALRQLQMHDCRTLITSSAEVYGKVDAEDLPIDEETPMRPMNPYAVSKIAQDYLGLQYYLSHGLPIIRVRPFNHIGPRQSPQFVVASFAKQIAEIEKGIKPPTMQVGNLQAKRDFTDVRDMIRAYELLIHNGKPGEVYNAGSGRSYAIEDVLHMLIASSTQKLEVQIDKSRVRPIDIPDAVCDNSRLVNLTNWKLTIPLEKSLHDTLDYWRQVV